MQSRVECMHVSFGVSASYVVSYSEPCQSHSSWGECTFTFLVGVSSGCRVVLLTVLLSLGSFCVCMVPDCPWAAPECLQPSNSCCALYFHLPDRGHKWVIYLDIQRGIWLWYPLVPGRHLLSWPVSLDILPEPATLIRCVSQESNCIQHLCYQPSNLHWCFWVLYSLSHALLRTLGKLKVLWSVIALLSWLVQSSLGGIVLQICDLGRHMHTVNVFLFCA